jgi:hypothetical protein
MSKLQHVLLGSVVGLTLVAGPAMARPHDWDDHRDHRRIERHMDRHDRYWHEGYRGYVGHDRVYWTLRRHHYGRWEGEPYWYRGHYVVRSYDRHGHVVFVEINPYTADFIGVIRF